MLQLQYPRLWQYLSISGLAVVLTATLIPSGWLWPDDPRSFYAFSDKWLHGITFAVLALWFSGQYARRAYWRIVLGLLAFGLLIELCQSVLSYRTAEMADMLANAAGMTAGLLIAMAGAGGWSLHFEKWLRERIG